MTTYSDMLPVYFQQSPLALGLFCLILITLSFLIYLSYTPSIDKRAPSFTSDTNPFIGSWGFYSRRWSFWKNSVARSGTGNFSFWLGKNHVVGVSGEAARKSFLEHPDLERVAAAVLHGVGPEIVPPIHPIFRSVPKGHSYFQRRVLDLVSAKRLAKHLPRVTKDARHVFEALEKGPKSFINPVNACYRLVLKQSCRVLCTDQISDTPALMDTYLDWTSRLQHLSSGHRVCMPWLPSLSHMKRRYCRRGLHNLVSPIVANRMKPGATRTDDTLQLLIDDGDSQEYITTFFISILFISVANAGKLAGVLLTMMANHADWQEKIYAEVKAAAFAHSKNKNASLVDQLDSLSLEAWEESFTFLELCFKEAIRMHVAFPMIRVNESRKAIYIPGTKEIIPPGSFVAYNTGDAHFDENLYPRPGRIEPLRFSEGRNEYKRESYAFLGWGNGRHRCVGQRWAKLQHYIVIAYALARFKWTPCDEYGNSVPPIDRETDFNKHGNSLAKGIFLIHSPREKA